MFHPKALVESKRVGAGTRVWAFAHVMRGAIVGRDCNICDHVFIEDQCVIGDRVTIKNGVSLWNGLWVEDDVFIGPNAAFTNDLYPVSRKACVPMKTRIRHGVSIGANSTVLCGITLGRYAFVGAGSVVTKTVPDFALVYGNPAEVMDFVCVCRKRLKFKGRRSRCGCGKAFERIARQKIRPVR